MLLVFADPAAANPHHRQRFGDYLSEYQHPTREVRVTDLHQWGPHAIGDDLIRARLMEVTPRPAS